MAMTLFGVCLILLFTILGYFRGVLRILAAIGSLIVAALLARFLSSPIQGWLQGSQYVPKALIPLAALFLAGVFLFLVGIVVSEFVLHGRKRKRLEQDLPALSSWERWGGAALGSAWGLCLVILIFIGIDIIGRVEEAMAPPPNPKEKQAPVEPGASRFADWRYDLNQSMFGSIVEQVNPVDEKVSRTFHNLTIVIGDPVLFEKFQNHPTVSKFANDPRLQEIARDPEIQQNIQNQDFYRLLDNEKIAALLENDGFFYSVKDVDMDAILSEIVQESESTNSSE